MSAVPNDLPRISAPTLWFFRGVVRRYFRRHFSAVRLSRRSSLDLLADPRVIIFGSHCSWWDPMMLVLLGEQLMPARQHFAPIDAAMLERYSIFRRLGMFGVEPSSARGAASFLRTSQTVLSAGGVLWITPQGRFADVRERPLAFRSGLATLAARLREGATLVPLAIEYPFWTERLPEALCHFGEPLRLEPGHSANAAALNTLVESRLEQTMDSLREDAVARDPARFHLLAAGRVGTGGFYQIGERISAALRGKPFQPAHGTPFLTERSKPQSSATPHPPLSQSERRG